MDRAPKKDFPASARAPDRCAERTRVLGAVKFMGLTVPAPVEPPPTLFSKVRSLHFRAQD